MSSVHAFESSYLVLGSHIRRKERTMVAKELGRDSSAYGLKTHQLAWFCRSLPGGYHRGPAENKMLLASFPSAKLPWEPSSLPPSLPRDLTGTGEALQGYLGPLAISSSQSWADSPPASKIPILQLITQTLT